MGTFSGSFFDEDEDKRKRDRMNGITPEYKTLLTPEEESSALKSIGSASLSGLAMAGNALDKYSGARAVRGILGDRPEEALSIIPFSDMLGWTKPENIVSGSYLNKKLFGASDDGIMSTLGGIATEIALDPTTYLTLGGSALTKTGAALAKHGFNPAKNVVQAAQGLKNIDELRWLNDGKVLRSLLSTGMKEPEIAKQFINQPLGGPLGFKIPFMKNRVALTGDAGVNVANAAEGVGNAISGAYQYAKALPYVGDIAKGIGQGAGVIGRAANAAFSSQYNNAMTPEGQAIFKEASQDAASNISRSRSDKNILRAALGEDNKFPELARWAVDNGEVIKQFAQKPALLSLNTAIASSMNDALRYLKSREPDLVKLTDQELLARAGSIYDRSSPMARMDGEVMRHSNPLPTENYMTIADRERVLAGGADTFQLDNLVHLGDGSTINTTYFPRYGNEVVDGRIARTANLANSDASVAANLTTARTLGALPQGALSVEMMAKDAAIAALRSTSESRVVDQKIGKAAEKIAVDYLKFPDAGAYQSAKQTGDQLTQLFGADAINRLKSGNNLNPLPTLTDDAYKVLNDINGLVPEIARQEAAKLGIHPDEWLRRFSISDDHLKAALLDQATYNTPKSYPKGYDPDAATLNVFSRMPMHVTEPLALVYGYSGLILDPAGTWVIRNPLIDNAFRIRNELKLQGKSPSYIAGLPVVEDATKGQIIAARNAKDIADVMANQSPAHLPAGTVIPGNGMFTGKVGDAPVGAPFYEHVLDSLDTRIASSFTGASKAKAVFNTVLGSGLKNVDPYNSVTFEKALRDVKLDPDRAIKNYADKYLDTNRVKDVNTNPLDQTTLKSIQDATLDLRTNRKQYVIDELAADLKIEPADLMANINNYGEAIARKENELAFRAVFKQLRVPQSTVNNIAQDVISFTPAAPLHPVLNMFDKYSDLLKGGLTIIAPGFHGRNLISGQTTNIASGSAGTRPWEVISNAYQADKAASGKVINNISQDLPLFQQINKERLSRGLPALTDQQATKRFNEMMYEYGVVSPHTVGELAVDPASLAAKVAQQVPGEVPTRSAGSLIGGFWDTSKVDPLTNTRATNFQNLSPAKIVDGQIASNMDNFAPFTWGRDVNQKIEGANRGGAFLGFLKQGYSPEQAAKLVAESHVDYSALTSFEKNVMKRAIPFYTFTKKMAPFVARDIMEHPGGLTAQYAKTAGRLRSQDENTALLPTHLGSSMLYDTTEMSKALGAVKPEGTRTFFTGLDLPVDVVAQYLSDPFGNKPFRGFESLLGSLNPVFKMPLELGTERQFFGHRNLDDLYSPTGNRTLDQVLMNSPISRLISMGRTAFDERKDPLTKALNLTLGGRFTDVDTQKWMNLRAKELIKERLTGTNGIGTFEKVYARPDKIQDLTRDQIELLRLQRNMELNALLYKKAHPRQ
jgi:hypothetical protein